MEIRRLNSEDLDWAKGVSDSSGLESWSIDSFRYFQEHECGFCFCAEVNGEKVAYFLGLLINGDLDIVSIATDPRFRRRGVARKLLAHVLDQASVKKAFLEVAVDNEAGLNLYDGLGFQREYVRQKYCQRTRDAWVMMRSEMGENVVW